MVGLPEFVLYIIIFSRNSQLYKLPFKGAALLKKAVYFSFDFNFGRCKGFYLDLVIRQ